MLELAALVVVSAVVLTFLTDATSDTLKMMRSGRRRGNVQAGGKHAAH